MYLMKPAIISLATTTLFPGFRVSLSYLLLQLKKKTTSICALQFILLVSSVFFIRLQGANGSGSVKKNLSTN